MTSDRLGVAIFVVWTVVLVAVPVVTIVLALRRRRHVGAGLVAVTVLAFAVLGVGWWLVLSPVVVDGTTCMSGSAAAGLLDDGLDMTEWAVPPADRLACRDLARQIVGGWAAAALAALAVWIVAVARAPRGAAASSAR
ncbi:MULTISPECIES: hypothetical protein [unclassified Isoptericola]|uniref:hypothetical protein n=1 Tax=unclassified Isoptericola TaxID=2623355 RepID=UPI0035E52A20|nr:hypothetical protein [Isoptericola sp. QY 916]